MKDDRVYALHMQECIDKIAKYTSGGRAAFLADALIQDGVTRNLQILAESSRRLSTSAKQVRPEIDWKNIAGLRNVVVHDYLGLELDQIWDIVEKDLPILQRAVAAICAHLETER